MQEETFRAAKVVFGHEALDEFVREGLTEMVSFKQKVLVLTISPVCVSKLPGILGPL